MLVKHSCLVWFLMIFFALGAQAEMLNIQEKKTRGVTIIHAGTLLAIPGQKPAETQSIIVEGDRIREIRDGYITASDISGDADIIDLSSQFVMPGFIDGHVHLYADGVDLEDENAPFYTEHSFMTDAEYALRSVKPALRTLKQGFTTIRSPGTHSTFAIRDLRDAINAGYIDGPRILSAIGMVEIPGGADDITVGLRDELMPLRTPPAACSNVADCKAAVRRMFKLGADFIKADNESFSMNPAHNRKRNQISNFTDEEMSAIVDTGHRLGLKVSVHAMGDTIIQALKAGADSIEHGWDFDGRVIREFKKSDAYLCPTWTSLMQGVHAARNPNSKMSKQEREFQLGRYERTKKAHAMALKAGVKFAFATDSGSVVHGQNLKEFLYLKDIGMSPMQAIVSATIHAADLAGLSDEIGTIETGKSADIIAVANNPLDKMENLLDMRFVMARGKVFRQE